MWQARQKYRQGIRQGHAIYQRGLDLYFPQCAQIAAWRLFGTTPKSILFTPTLHTLPELSALPRAELRKFSAEASEISANPLALQVSGSYSSSVSR